MPEGHQRQNDSTTDVAEFDGLVQARQIFATGHDRLSVAWTPFYMLAPV
jgi:hypothetical protein